VFNLIVSAIELCLSRISIRVTSNPWLVKTTWATGVASPCVVGHWRTHIWILRFSICDLNALLLLMNRLSGQEWWLIERRLFEWKERINIFVQLLVALWLISDMDGRATDGLGAVTCVSADLSWWIQTIRGVRFIRAYLTVKLHCLFLSA
jgi:hypothetical protein